MGFFPTDESQISVPFPTDSHSPNQQDPKALSKVLPRALLLARRMVDTHDLLIDPSLQCLLRLTALLAAWL